MPSEKLHPALEAATAAAMDLVTGQCSEETADAAALAAQVALKAEGVQSAIRRTERFIASIPKLRGKRNTEENRLKLEGTRKAAEHLLRQFKEIAEFGEDEGLFGEVEYVTPGSEGNSK